MGIVFRREDEHVALSAWRTIGKHVAHAYPRGDVDCRQRFSASGVADEEIQFAASDSPFPQSDHLFALDAGIDFRVNLGWRFGRSLIAKADRLCAHESS